MRIPSSGAMPVRPFPLAWALRRPTVRRSRELESLPSFDGIHRDLQDQLSTGADRNAFLPYGDEAHELGGELIVSGLELLKLELARPVRFLFEGLFELLPLESDFDPEER